MLKHVLLASAFAISAPVFAQDMPGQDATPSTQAQNPPVADPNEPAPAEDTSTVVDDAADQATPAQPAAPAQPANPGQSSATPVEPAQPATPVQPDANQPDATEQGTPDPQPATPAQIAQLVDKDFGAYDKDGDGSLKTAEFGAWMVALRSATEPAFTGQSAADKDWISKALAMADKDRSGGVSNAELKGFLAPQAAS